jgi:pyrimidine operon attenuation protein/uracil phosphoribosyltransferase|tara:strand:- start:8511 stop:9005 length:495 start_codon:yes stop_codon:yes gene_type:complete
MQRILTSEEMNQKLVRLAHQIIEFTYDVPVCYLGGITGNGFTMAKALRKIIQENSKQKIELFEITVNKVEPWNHEVKLSISEDKLKNGTILLVDDVLNSGKTMQYALVKLLQQPTAAIKTVAMVDRKHRRYPIKADFVGLSLSTTLSDTVEIRLNKDKYEAYLV